MEKLIITCAITGAETTKNQNPALPITPEEQAQAALDCYNAGASIIHLHVRDDAGGPNQSIERFGDAIDRIREKCSVIIQISTGGAVGTPISERMRPLDLRPEMASLNIGSINFGEEIFLNSPPEVVNMIGRVQERGVVPEVEIYDLGMLEFARKLISKGILRPSRGKFHFQFVLGTSHGLSGEVKNICHLIEGLHGINASWAVAGIGKYQLPAAAHATLMGGHVRVGFEDNVYWSKGVLAKSNAQLVERVAQLSKTFNRSVASPEEAREILCLK